MNWIDKAIGFVSPQAGYRRARFRAAEGALLRYEGAQASRRTAGWSTGAGSANAEIGPDLARLRERTRDLVRNNPHAKKALRVYTNNAIGTGIWPRAATGNPKLNAAIDAAFSRWAEECDADGQLDFAGLQALISRTERMSGECLIRFRNRREQDGLHVPLQIQVLEPDFIDSNKSYYLDTAGNYSLQGIQFDQLGQRTAYWMFNQHPGEIMRTSLKGFISKLVPASEILHVYWKERPGQVRGVPFLAAVVIKLRDLDEYGEAEIVRKKIEACLAAFVTQPEAQDGPSLAPTSTALDGVNRIETFEPGMIEYGKPGEDIKFNAPAPAGGYREYKTTELHDVAAGAEVMYEQMTGDLSLVNYSSYRAGHLEFRGDIDAYRWQMFIPMAGLPIWRRFIDTAFLAGVIPEQNYGVKWDAPAFQSIDPEKDANAERMQIRTGTMTLPQAIAAHGHDPADQFEEIEQTNKLLDEKRIVVDSDPRKVTDKGLAQPTAQGGDPGGQKNNG